eukprot:scaffold279511_cov12-Tisochrysis_lutea.AAC.1
MRECRQGPCCSGTSQPAASRCSNCWVLLQLHHAALDEAHPAWPRARHLPEAAGEPQELWGQGPQG